MKTRIGWMLALCLFTLINSYGGIAQDETTMPPPQSDQLEQPLGFWASAAFVWVILILAMAFVIAMGWLSRSRRY